MSGGNDEDIRMWDARSGECLRIMPGHTQLVRTLHLDSQNKRVISGSYDKVCFYYPRTSLPCGTEWGYANSLVTQSVKVWDSEDGKLLLDIQKFHSSWVLAAKADYRRIVSTSQDYRTLILDFSIGLPDLHILE